MKRDCIRAAAFETLENRRLLAANLISDAAGLYPTDAVRAGGYDYFFANDGTHGRELWKSGVAGTSLVSDVTDGPAGTEAMKMAAVGDRVLFLTRVKSKTISQSQTFNYTVWSSDGTDAGTVAVAAFKNVAGMQTQGLGDRAVFSVYAPNADGSESSAIWGTDGTAAGTAKLQAFYAAEGGGSAWVNDFSDLGGRAVARIGQQLWSTDGTKSGTFDLTEVADFDQNNGVDSAQISVGDGRLVLVSRDGRLLVNTDGTVAGTVSKAIDAGGYLDGQMESSIVNGRVYVVSVHSDGNDIIKNVYGVNVNTGELTGVYSPKGDASAHRIEVTAVRGGIAISDMDAESRKTVALVSDGTTAGTHVVEADDNGYVLGKAELDGVLYTTRLIRVGTDDGGTVGARQGDDGGMMITGGGSRSRVELWRSDGTAEGTARVRTLLNGSKYGDLNYFTLSTANGKLVLRHESGTLAHPNGPISGDDLTRGITGDETTVFDATELLPGREAAVARLVNGVLRIGGSTGDDDILVYRRASDPEQLVVEYNGNTRVFATGEVTRIKADLQDGADRFELREGDEGFLRLRTAITGGDGNDTIVTASGRDTISGGNGSDKIYAGRGADQVNGGAGGDRINGQSGDDRINAGSGRDRVTSGGGVDVLFGMSAIEMAFGTNADGQSYADDVLLA